MAKASAPAAIRLETTDIARTAIAPSLGNAITLKSLLKFEGLELPELVHELGKQSKQVANNNLDRVTAILTSQTHTLDALFNNLARLAFQNTGDLDAFDRIMRLALRAQSQTCGTAAAIGVLKNPPTLIGRQTNVAHGPQQVNNALPPLAPPGAPNELLETPAHGKRLDGAAAGEAISGDPVLATVGAVHGADHTRG